MTRHTPKPDERRSSPVDEDTAPEAFGPAPRRATAPAGNAVSAALTSRWSAVRTAGFDAARTARFDPARSARSEKVNSVRIAVESGQYRIDKDKVAEKLVDEELAPGVKSNRP